MKRRDALGLMSKMVVVAGAFNALSPNALWAAEDFRVVDAKLAQILQEGKAKMFCPVCGMTLPMYYRTNHAATVKNSTHQYCSIHCMFEEAMLGNAIPKNPQVVDNDTLKFIKSEEAYYVVGSAKPGTMSTVSKYAFGSEKSAQAFAKEFGGEMMRYAKVSEVVTAGLAKDIELTKQNQAKAAKMGEKIYQNVCKAEPKRFATAAEAKVYLMESKVCGNLQGKEFQQVGLYLAGKGAI
jgi:nitrous oxide reductase accessory protein NosL